MKQLDAVSRDLAGVHFSYSDPAPNFDRSKVKGLVAELVDVDKNHLNSCTALEVCAGGKLYNVSCFFSVQLV